LTKERTGVPSDLFKKICAFFTNEKETGETCKFLNAGKCPSMPVLRFEAGDMEKNLQT
jgi:hypothetical protein